MKKQLFMLASLLLVGPAMYGAGSERAGSLDVKAAFDRVRGLAGEWEAKTDRGTIRATYEVIAGGSAVVERTFVENMPVMETIYHPDGARLLLTHYCMLGNQPRMQARAFDPATGELRFEFLDATNLASPAAEHMHNATLRLIDANHFAGEWQLFENQHLKSTENFQFVRVR